MIGRTGEQKPNRREIAQSVGRANEGAVLPITESRDLPISRSRTAGVALLAVMSAVSVMLLVAAAFSSSVQIETRTAIYRKESAQAYALAVGGVQAAILEIAYPPSSDQQDKPQLWKSGQRLLRVPYAHGVGLVEIVNEAGKLDLNVAGPEQLRRLFEARGLEAAQAVNLATAIDHWRSPPGSDSEEFKALDEYYRDAGYHAAHERFTSVEEALRVRGMTRDIFYGTVGFSREKKIQYKYGMGQDLTIYSRSPLINVNYATEEALLSVPGVSESLAGAIVEERVKKPFQSVDEMVQRLAVSLPDKALPFLTTGTCKTYSIVSVGTVSGSRVRRTVKAIVQVGPRGAALHRIIAWYDDATE
ncbi:MAG TPA: helix-hairpin-helix domain-containing protein [Terriglobia bacterium]|nr:helix-hairpin-helix domain-containing protein [Terriglobia bacterium]